MGHTTSDGKSDFSEYYEKHQVENNPNRATSRDVFHAFYQTIVSRKNPTVGDIPQIVNVFRKPYSGGIHSGVIIDGKRYISGQLVDKGLLPDGMQWLNENFEITNPQTKRREKEAQVQPSLRC